MLPLFFRREESANVEDELKVLPIGKVGFFVVGKSSLVPTPSLQLNQLSYSLQKVGEALVSSVGKEFFVLRLAFPCKNNSHTVVLGKREKLVLERQKLEFEFWSGYSLPFVFTSFFHLTRILSLSRNFFG